MSMAQDLSWITIAFLVGTVAAQEPPLGDVARATRAHIAASPQATRVYRNEDANPQEIKPGDDPLEVYQRAGVGLKNDNSHRCVTDSAGNSGPGWKKHEVFEIAGPGSKRIVFSDQTTTEYTIVGDDYYAKNDNAPWRKLGKQEDAAVEMAAGGLPQEMMFSLEPGSLKFIANETIAGASTVHYRDSIHAFQLDRTIDYWFGSKDSLPRRIEMSTHELDTTTAGTSWHESITCTYVAIEIKAPI